MKQIFILGASFAYGVGAEKTGWGDLVKQHYHNLMYSRGGVGEKYEVYNFSKSGAATEFVLETFPEQLRQFGRGDKIISIVSVGGNDSKAIGSPNNYVSTVEEYISKVKKLYDLLSKSSSKIIFVGDGFVDEAKTNPKISPFDGSKSYFTNSRRTLFHSALKELCDNLKITFIDTPVAKEDWINNYLYEDGLHPNQKGHDLIFNEIKNLL